MAPKLSSKEAAWRYLLETRPEREAKDLYKRAHYFVCAYFQNPLGAHARSPTLTKLGEQLLALDAALDFLPAEVRRARCLRMLNLDGARVSTTVTLSEDDWREFENENANDARVPIECARPLQVRSLGVSLPLSVSNLRLVLRAYGRLFAPGKAPSVGDPYDRLAGYATEVFFAGVLLLERGTPEGKPGDRSILAFLRAEGWWTRAPTATDLLALAIVSGLEGPVVNEGSFEQRVNIWSKRRARAKRIIDDAERGRAPKRRPARVRPEAFER